METMLWELPSSRLPRHLHFDRQTQRGAGSTAHHLSPIVSRAICDTPAAVQIAAD